jgi:hypothetical protein
MHGRVIRRTPTPPGQSLNGVGGEREVS